MHRFPKILATTLLALTGAVAGCAPTERLEVPAHPSAHTVYVMSSGWHSGIVVARADVDAVNGIPERRDFPNARFLEFGWGDRDYYPSPRPSLGLALGAAFASSASVMHLVGYDQAPRERYRDAEVFALPLSAAGLEQLVTAIDASFERSGTQRAEIVAPGFYRDSHFYPARGRFSLANTCNTWTARMLAEAGADISPYGVVTASDLVSRLRALPGIAGPP